MLNRNKALFAGLCAVLCWSTVATAFKLSLNHINPAQLIMVASLVSWCFFILVLTRQGRLRKLFTQTTRTYFQSFCFGLMNPILYYYLLFSAYRLLPAQEAQVINYSWAIVMSLLAIPLLGQKLSWSDIIAATLCYLGVLVIATRGDLLSFEFNNPTGVFLAVASTIIWSLYWIYNKRAKREAVVSLCLNFSFAIPIILIYLWLTGQLTSLAWQGIAGGIYIGLFEMGLAFVLWHYAIKNSTSTARVANLIFLSPFVSLLVIAVVLGETILLSTILALGLILTGLAIQQHSSVRRSTI